jgi:hypothetical protein
MDNELVDDLCRALRVMSGNFMRVARGAGQPEQFYAQATAVVAANEALKAAGMPMPVNAISEALYISKPVVANADENAYQHHVNDIVWAGLRIAAARHLGQPTQEKAGLHDLHNAAPFKRPTG